MNKTENMVMVYVYLAVASFILGLVLVFVVLYVCQYFGIDITENWWVLAVPVTLAVIFNIVFVELYRKFRRK